MGRRRKKDYIKVLKSVKRNLGDREPSLKKVVLDFEAAEWQAFREVFPDADIQGCNFHFCQAIYRQIQAKHLSNSYKHDKGTKDLCNQLMALAYVPAEHIKPVFRGLKKKAMTSRLRNLFTYIEDFWIEGSIFNPECFSVFNQAVRTNNDVEGWHHRLNRKANKKELAYYKLIDLLYEEAMLVEVQYRLISDNKMEKRQRKKFKKMEGRLFKYWGRYVSKDLSVADLVRKCGHLVAPSESPYLQPPAED